MPGAMLCSAFFYRPFSGYFLCESEVTVTNLFCATATITPRWSWL